MKNPAAFLLLGARGNLAAAAPQSCSCAKNCALDPPVHCCCHCQGWRWVHLLPHAQGQCPSARHSLGPGPAFNLLAIGNLSWEEAISIMWAFTQILSSLSEMTVSFYNYNYMIRDQFRLAVMIYSFPFFLSTLSSAILFFLTLGEIFTPTPRRKNGSLAKTVSVGSRDEIKSGMMTLCCYE